VSDEERVKGEELLRGLEFVSLPSGWSPLGAAVLVKCINEDGRVAWSFRTSDELNDEELLGALVLRTELMRRALADDYTDPDGAGD